ncbi:hypothetical protein HYT23_06420 [Candidatus Pacearchaeota archaeon]|nr:hypothetical protein [Candidatus Pacearchaeota archaeon]
MANTLLKKIIRTQPGEGHWGPVYGAIAAGRDMYDPKYKDRKDLGSFGWFGWQAAWLAALTYGLNLIK